jgi:hypothetical protein
MGILSWFKESFKYRSPYETRVGWIYDGTKVREAALMQMKHPGRSDMYGQYDMVTVPAKGDWWVDILDGRRYRKDAIFRSKDDASRYALNEVDKRIFRMAEERDALRRSLNGEGYR